MNQRRVAHLCLWCEEIWSDDHKCVNKPSYNCMFSFGEDDEGFAFVMVTKEALKPSSMNELQEEVLPLSKNHPLEEIGEPDPCISLDWTVISDARQMFDEMPIPDFILEMAQLAKTSQVEFEGCDHEIGIDEVHYDQLPENQGSVVRSSEVLRLNNENDDTNQGKNGEIQVGDQCSNPSFSLVDEVIGKFSCFGQPIFIDKVHLPKAHYMFDEVLKGDDDDANVSLEIIARDDILASKYNMCDESLRPNLESILPLEHEIMIINVKFQHFIPLLGVKNELVKKIVDLEDLRWNMNGSICCYVLVFDPRDLLMHINMTELNPCTKFFESKNGWKANISYKEVHSWSKVIVQMHIWEPLDNIIELPSFQNDVTCPWINREMFCYWVKSYLGCHPSVLLMVDVEMVSSLLGRKKLSSLFSGILFSRFGIFFQNDTSCSWINDNGTILHVLVFIIKQSNNAHLPFGFTYVYPCTLLCMLLNELGGNKKRSWVGFKRATYMCLSFLESRIMLLVIYDLCLKTLSLFEFSYSRIIVVFSVLIFTLTLEDKGGFEEVGSDSVGLLLWRTLSSWRAIGKKNCERKRQLTANNISRSIRVSYFIFDPGGLNNSLTMTMNSYVAEVVWVFDPGGLFVVIVLVFDPGGSKDLLGVISGDFKLGYKDATRRPMIVLTLEDKGVLKEWELIHPKPFLQLIYYF
ncbi:hypothetical protein RND81_06G182700 [Saponaria officinalis]|uniref:Uncharacterized protein n=1 Tax=Saponaria officinalis TaxID=3572 RepID=A0AAW1KCD9_SAPOF